MRIPWHLAPLLPLAPALAHNPFGLFDDVLAFPQYEVVFSDKRAPNEDILAHLRAIAPGLEHRLDSDQLNRIQKILSLPSEQSSNGDESSADEGGATEINKRTRNKKPDVTEETIVQNGQRYICEIPLSTEPPAEPEPRLIDEDDHASIEQLTSTGLQLINGMEGHCIYLLDVWWAYQFCYNRDVRQFRPANVAGALSQYPPIPDPHEVIFLLGRFVPSKLAEKDGDKGNRGTPKRDSRVKTTVKEQAGTRYLVQNVMDGTPCDVVPREREVEVQYHCDPKIMSDKIVMLKEVSVCSYVMVIYTPRLCTEPLFHPPVHPPASTISCSPVGSPDKPPFGSTPLSDTLAQKKQPSLLLDSGSGSVLDSTSDATVSSSPGRGLPLPMVGNIAVGARKLVGKPGRVIERSLIVGGRSLVVLVADSSGFVMSTEEFRKQYQSAKYPDLAKVKKELEKVAAGKRWRLELVHSGAGRRELQGILLDDDEEVAQEDKTKKEPAETLETKKGEQRAPNPAREEL